MTTGNGRGTSNRDDFNEALAELIEEAVLRGVEVEGGWDVTSNSGEEVTEFTVEVYRMDG